MLLLLLLARPDPGTWMSIDEGAVVAVAALALTGGLVRQHRAAMQTPMLRTMRPAAPTISQPTTGRDIKPEPESS